MWALIHRFCFRIRLGRSLAWHGGSNIHDWRTPASVVTPSSFTTSSPKMPRRHSTSTKIFAGPIVAHTVNSNCRLIMLWSSFTHSLYILFIHNLFLRIIGSFTLTSFHSNLGG